MTESRYCATIRDTTTRFLNWAGEGGWGRVLALLAGCGVFVAVFLALVRALFSTSEHDLLVLILLVLIFKKG